MGWFKRQLKAMDTHSATKDKASSHFVRQDVTTNDIEIVGQENTYEVEERKREEPQINVGGHGGTQRRLRDYQVTMIGFCSGIGTGLFVGAGAAYASAGPAGLLLAYTVVGTVLWCVMQTISELATVVSLLTSQLASASTVFRLLTSNYNRSPPQVLFLIGQLGSSTQLLDFLWLFHMVIVTPSPLPLKSQPRRFW